MAFGTALLLEVRQLRPSNVIHQRVFYLGITRITNFPAIRFSKHSTLIWAVNGELLAIISLLYIISVHIQVELTTHFPSICHPTRNKKHSAIHYVLV